MNRKNDLAFLDLVDSQNQTAVVRAVRAGQDLEVCDDAGMTALGIAVKYGNLGMVDFLASAGAIVSDDVMRIASMSSRSSRALLVHLATWKAKQIRPDVTGLSAPDSALLVSSYAGDAEAVRSALKAGALVDAHDHSGTSAMRFAIRQDHVDIVRLLIESGADVNKVSAHGWTALMEAGAMGSSELVSILIESGADLSFRNAGGQSAETVARYGGHDELADTLRV